MEAFRSVCLLAGVATAAAQIEPGVSNPLYACTDVSRAPRLAVEFDSVGVACGTQVPIVEANVQPAVAYSDSGGSRAEYYTLVCLNPDDIIPVGPIIHHGVGNVKADDLALGRLGDNATTFVEFFGPSPPVGGIEFTYFYQLYAQAGGMVDYPVLESFLFFPVAQFAEDNDLVLVEQNYWLTDANV